MTVTPTSGATDKATVSGALMFTTENWDTEQDVTITGLATGTATITHAATSSDTSYDGATIASVTATVSASSKTFRIESSATAAEGANAELTVTLGQAAPTGGLALAVSYDYTGSTATTADTGTTPAALTVAATETTATLTIPIAQDQLVEGSETFTATISTAVDGWAKVSGEDAATVTITDDEASGAKIAFGTATRATAHTATVDEDVTGGVLNVPVAVNFKPQASTIFAVEVAASSTATAWASAQAPGDYRIGTSSVTFGPGASDSTTQNLAVTITDDMLVEDDQTIVLRITDSSGADNLGAHYTRNAASRVSTVTIEDDDADEAKIAFGNSASSTSESPVTATETDADAAVSVPVTISAKPESEITIPITVVSTGTTASAADYTITTSSVTFGPGSSDSTTQNLTVTVKGDELVEADQTIVLRVADTSSGLGRHYARDATSRQTTFTINDDERPGAKIAFGADAAGIAAYTADVDEDDGTVNVPLTLTDLPESSTTFTVEVLETATRPATEYTNAQAPGDYRVLGSKQVTFAPTDADNTENVRVALQNNDLVEYPETVELRIVAEDDQVDDLGDHYARNAQSRLATLTVADDDAAAATIAVGSNAASEAVFTVDRREGAGHRRLRPAVLGEPRPLRNNDVHPGRVDYGHGHGGQRLRDRL